MLRALDGIQSPGYGSGQFGEKIQPDGTSLAGFSVEIPRADKERVFVFRGHDKVYTLIDDFVYSFAPHIKCSL